MDMTKVSHSRLVDIGFHLHGTPFPAIYPVDFESAGHIVDDVGDGAVFRAHQIIPLQQMHDILVKPLPRIGKMYINFSTFRLF
jgi:hypothetical protein